MFQNVLYGFILMLHYYCVTDKCLLHFQIQDRAGLGSYNIFSRFSDFRLCSLLLEVDLTPDIKKISLLVIHVFLVLASVKW